MKKTFFILLSFLIFNGYILSQKVHLTSANTDKFSVVLFTSSNLPIVVINTNGQMIPDDYKITADMGIIYNGEGVRNYLTDPFQ